MVISNLTQKIQMHGVLVALPANCNDSDMASFLKVEGSFMFKNMNYLRGALAEMCHLWPREKQTF